MRASFYQNRRVAEEWWSKAHLGKVRVVSSLLKIMLLMHGDSSFYQGRQVFLQKRSLGAGVYEIWLEPRKEEEK